MLHEAKTYEHLFQQTLGKTRDEAIAQWNHLRLPSCRPWFKSQACHLHFFIYLCCICHVKRAKINKKEAGFGPFLKKTLGKNGNELFFKFVTLGLFLSKAKLVRELLKLFKFLWNSAVGSFWSWRGRRLDQDLICGNWIQFLQVVSSTSSLPISLTHSLTSIAVHRDQCDHILRNFATLAKN